MELLLPLLLLLLFDQVLFQLTLHMQIIPDHIKDATYNQQIQHIGIPGLPEWSPNMNRQRPPFIVPKTVVIGGANTKKHNLPVSSSYRKPPFENQHHSSPYHTLLAYKHIYSDSDKDSLKRHTQQRSYSDYNQDLSPAYNQELYRATPKGRREQPVYC